MFNMILVPFTGIDNHKRCIIFGFGLLSSENIESYSWILYALKKIVNVPNLVVIDQRCCNFTCSTDAIQECKTKILYVAHISIIYRQDVFFILYTCMQLGSQMAKTDVLKKLSGLIWNETILKEDFESTWKNIMGGFELNENNWVNEMYTMRDLCIPAYFKECSFFGLRRATSKFEIDNYLYGLLFNSNFHLIEFSTHFDTTLCVLASMVSCMPITIEESLELKIFILKDIEKHSKHHGQYEVKLFKSDKKLICSSSYFN
uniref:MULE transposase domain-containing protein n=1 Tax=Lactuca sativa TaxID=4236 RepID=A0A9R1VMY9_LACSA|nr:hypothetical protein LSAT_V11C400185270 [Lactuca sativa]